MLQNKVDEGLITPSSCIICLPPVKLFCEMNDLILNWRKIARLLPRREIAVGLIQIMVYKYARALFMGVCKFRDFAYYLKILLYLMGDQTRSGRKNGGICPLFL